MRARGSPWSRARCRITSYNVCYTKLLRLTFAVWPNATHTRDSVGLITERKRDLIIHFPMEPRGYPQYNPGDDALFVSMTREQIEQRVEENVSRIPEAIGVNNHMGSVITSYSIHYTKLYEAAPRR